MRNITNKQYLEKLDDTIRLNRRWHFEELKEYIEGNNYLENVDEHMMKPEYEEKAYEMYFNYDDDLELPKTDYMFNMKTLRNAIEDFDYEGEGFKDSMLWDCGYLAGYRDALENHKIN